MKQKNIDGEEERHPPNIRVDYTVTDKADGDRKLMFISKNRRIYLIDTNMNVQFTGAISKNDQYGGTLMDGEHIKYDKNGEYITSDLDFRFVSLQHMYHQLLLHTRIQ